MPSCIGHRCCLALTTPPSRPPQRSEQARVFRMQPSHHHTAHSMPTACPAPAAVYGKGRAHILFAALLLESPPLGKLRAVRLPSGHGQSRGEEPPALAVPA